MNEKNVHTNTLGENRTHTNAAGKNRFRTTYKGEKHVHTRGYPLDAQHSTHDICIPQTRKTHGDMFWTALCSCPKTAVVRTRFPPTWLV